LTDLGADTCIWGAFWGILLQQKFSRGIISGEVKDEAWWRPYARAAVAVATVSPFLLWFYILDAVSDLKAVGAMILVTLIPFVGGSITLFCLTDWVNVKLGLLEIEQTESNDLNYA